MALVAQELRVHALSGHHLGLLDLLDAVLVGLLDPPKKAITMS